MVPRRGPLEGLDLSGEPLRVALLTPCFWPEVRRGSERFARELASGLIARGHQPRLLTSHPGPTSFSEEDGLPIVRHRRPPDGLLRRARLEDHLTHVPRSYRSLTRGDDEVAQALFVTDAVAAGRWSARTGRPSVFSYMGIPDRPGLEHRRLRAGLTRRAVHTCSAVTALSRAAAQAFRSELGVDPRVIHPGVDLAAFSPAQRRAEEPTIFCAADLREPRKRVPLLVEAFRAVRRERPGARLVLSRPGDPVAAERFQRDHPDVELADVDDRAELARAYGEAWVSALPSEGEAFGLVLAEGLACGTPGVASHTGGMPEVIDRPEVGRLFSGGSPEDLARALIEALELAEDPGTARACVDRARVFSLDRCVESHLQLYRELLAGPG
jgi:glycosyltransferase involved in cell wall biosynthesis